MGETPFFPLQLKPFIITMCNYTSIGSCSAIKTNQWRRTAYCVEDTVWEPVQSRHAMRGDDLKPRITWE